MLGALGCVRQLSSIDKKAQFIVRQLGIAPDTPLIQLLGRQAKHQLGLFPSTTTGVVNGRRLSSEMIQ